MIFFFLMTGFLLNDRVIYPLPVFRLQEEFVVLRAQLVATSCKHSGEVKYSFWVSFWKLFCIV